MDSEADHQVIKSHDDSRTTTDSDAEPEVDSSKKVLPSNPSFLELLSRKDKEISLIVHEMETNHFFEYLIYLCGRLFNPDVISCYFIILIAYNAYYYKNYFYIVKPLIHVLVILIITLVLKHWIGRPRPHLNTTIKRRYNLRSKEKNCSMPSGDSMQCASFSIIFYFYMNTTFGFILIPLVMFSRIFYYCHFLMDTVIGTILGMGISYLLMILLRQF